MSSWRDDYQPLAPLAYSAMGISFLGSAFIIVSYTSFKQLRNFALQLVLYLAVADFILSGAALLSLIRGENALKPASDGEPMDTLCYIQAPLIEYSFLSAVLWVDIIAWAIYSTVMRIGDVKNQMKYFYAIGFGVPVVVSIIPFFFGSYGSFGPGYWCWINFDINEMRKSIIVSMIAYTLPLLGSIIFITYTVCKVNRLVRKSNHSMGGGGSFIVKLKYYPIVLVVCWSSITIHVFLFIFSNISNLQVELSWMKYLDTTLACSQGLFNALVFGLTQSVREVFKEHMGCKEGKVRPEFENELTDQKSSDESSSEDTQRSKLDTSLTVSA